MKTRKMWEVTVSVGDIRETYRIPVRNRVKAIRLARGQFFLDHPEAWNNLIAATKAHRVN